MGMSKSASTTRTLKKRSTLSFFILNKGFKKLYTKHYTKGDTPKMRLGIQIRKNDSGYNYVQIDSNDYEKIEQALGEQRNISTGTFGYDITNEQRLRNVLSMLYDNHAQFYDHIGFEASPEHGPTGQDFSTSGFKKFMEEAFNCTAYRPLRDISGEDALQTFCDLIAERITEIVENYEDDLIPEEENFVAHSTITVDAEPSGKLTDPEIFDEAVVVTNDGAKKLQVQDVEDAESLEDVKNQVEENTRHVYERQVEAQVEPLKKRISNLQDKLEQERREMMVKGIQMVNELDNWKVENGYLVYQETVNLQTAQLNRDDSEPTELTEEAKEKFYIKNLKVPIRQNIRSPKYDDAYHPHALSSGSCTGDFRAEMSAEGLQDVVEQMQHADLHDASHTDAERELKNNWDDYIKTDEDGEPEQTEVWEAE